MRCCNKQKQNVSLADNDTLFLKNEYKIIRINISDIRYVEGMGEYLKIHFISDRKPLMILSSMKKMEKHLANNSFMRIHRSWIINLIDINEVNKNRILMNDGMYVPIGDMYREGFLNYVDSKFFR